ncbi:MAG: cytidine deaminase [Selenomonadaceae bacterium]|nr:cytidine deaminase [Selenomonadaceae bacterium]
MNYDIMDTMVRIAMEAIRNAYTLNHNLAVGACVLTSDGTLYSGCTVDHSIPELSLSAESVAMAKAISDGKREFDAIALIADIDGYYIPDETSCQFLGEFNVKDIVLADFEGNIEIAKIDDILPFRQRRKKRNANEDTFLFNGGDN